MKMTAKDDGYTMVTRIELFILFITFMVLKLTWVIDWSWWWVSMPITAPIAVFMLVRAVKVFVKEVRR